MLKTKVLEQVFEMLKTKVLELVLKTVKTEVLEQVFKMLQPEVLEQVLEKVSKRSHFYVELCYERTVCDPRTVILVIP